MQFGLTETVGTMPAKRAKAFVEEIRARMDACPDKDLGTEVERVAHRAGDDRDLSVWHVTTEISDDKSVSFLMGIVREGTAIAQVGFVPDGDVTMAPGEFIALVERAGQRLPALPRHRSGRQLRRPRTRLPGKEAAMFQTTLRRRHVAAAVLATAALVTVPVVVMARDDSPAPETADRRRRPPAHPRPAEPSYQPEPFHAAAHDGWRTRVPAELRVDTHLPEPEAELSYDGLAMRLCGAELFPTTRHPRPPCGLLHGSGVRRDP